MFSDLNRLFHVKDLDVRIRNISDIKTIVTAVDDTDLIGLKGYFADFMNKFTDLKKCHYDTPASIAEFYEVKVI